MHVIEYQILDKADLIASANVISDAPDKAVLGMFDIVCINLIFFCQSGAGTLVNVDWQATLRTSPFDGSQGQPVGWAINSDENYGALAAEGTTVQLYARNLKGMPMVPLDRFRPRIFNDGTPKTGIDGFMYVVHRGGNSPIG